jgi:hypothetical protein
MIAGKYKPVLHKITYKKVLILQNVECCLCEIVNTNAKWCILKDLHVMHSANSEDSYTIRHSVVTYNWNESAVSCAESHISPGGTKNSIVERRTQLPQIYRGL